MATYYADISNGYLASPFSGRNGTQARPFTVDDVFLTLIDGGAVNGVTLANGDTIRMRGVYGNQDLYGNTDLAVDNLVLTSWEDRQPWMMIGEYPVGAEGPYPAGTLRITYATNANLTFTIEDGLMDMGLSFSPGVNGTTSIARNIMGSVGLSLGLGITGTLTCEACYGSVETSTGPGAPLSTINVRDSVFYDTRIVTGVFSNVTINHQSNLTSLTQADFESQLAGAVAQTGRATNSYEYVFASVPPTRVSVNPTTQITLSDLSYTPLGLPIVYPQPARWATNDYDRGFDDLYRFGYGAFWFQWGSFTATPTSGSAPLTVEFDADAPKLGSDYTYDYEWDFGDGGTSQEEDPTYTFNMPGQWKVTLTITAPWGDVYTGSMTIYVYDWDYDDERLQVSVTDRCLRYAYRPKQGVGWAYYGGDDWIWPEARHGALRLVDTTGQLIQLAFDARTGLAYRMDRDVWEDKRSGSYAGTEITCNWRHKEDRGSAEHYFIESLNQFGHFRPYDEDLRDTTGHDSQGYRNSFEVESGLYADGEQILPAAVSQEIPIDGQVVHDRRVEAHRLQPYYETTTSEFKFVRRRSYYIAKDRAAPPSKRTMSEMDWQESLSEVSFWQSRGPNLLLNRFTGDDANGSIFASCNGPDGDNVSAMLFNGAEGTWDTIDNLTGDFTIMFWLAQLAGATNVIQIATGNLVIQVSGTEIRMTDVTNAYGADLTWDLAGWRFFAVQRDGNFIRFIQNKTVLDTDVIGTYNTYGGRLDVMLNLTGRVFDPRVIPENLTLECLNYYYDNVVDYNGNAVLPVA